MLPEPHPDTVTSWKEAKAICNGGRQAIEDKAIEAYQKALEEGRSKDEASQQYFEMFRNSKS